MAIKLRNRKLVGDGGELLGEIDHFVRVPIAILPVVGTLFHSVEYSVLGGLSLLERRGTAGLMEGNTGQGNLEVCNEIAAFTSRQTFLSTGCTR